MSNDEKVAVVTDQLKIRGLLGRWFWVWAVLGAAILGLRLMTGGTDRGDGHGTVIGGASVKPGAPDADEVERVRAKRAEEMQREREKQQRGGERRRLEIEKRKLLADVDARVSKYRGDVNAIVEKYRRMLPLSEAEECFGRAEQGADFIASSKGLCGFKVCSKLACKIACDKIKGTSTAEDAINPIVSAQIVAPIEEAVDVYGKFTEDFRRELQCEEQAFAMDLALRSQKFTETVSCFKKADASRMELAVDKLVSEVKEHAQESVFAAAGTMVELAMIKSSSAAVKSVAVSIARIALGSVAKKLATTMSAAVISTMADGPLPVGDVVAAVITAGGLGWTAYDIYKVTKTMPREMREGLRSSIDEMRTALRRTADENLNSDRDVCLRSAEARAKELQGLINK